MSIQKVLLCPFYFKTRPSGVSIKSPDLENILQVPGNGAEFDENSARFLGTWGIFSSPGDSKLTPDGLVLK